MNKRLYTNKNWNDPLKRKFTHLTISTPQPKFTHLTEENAVRGGEGAFKIRVYLSNNPYSDKNLSNAWVRGYKRAERLFNDSLRTSAKIQSTLELEEVEA